MNEVFVGGAFASLQLLVSSLSAGLVVGLLALYVTGSL